VRKNYFCSFAIWIAKFFADWNECVCICCCIILPGEGCLTSEALQKHDALLGAGRRSGSEESQDGDGDATFRTFQTFASDWSECSNVSFNK
jgi:hypothetical protein